MPTCRVCKRYFEFNNNVGYDRSLCGMLCDGVEAGRDRVIGEMRSLAEQFRAKGDVITDSEAGLAFEACASSVERVCNEMEGK